MDRLEIYTGEGIREAVDRAIGRSPESWTAEERALVMMSRNFDQFSDRIHAAHAEEQLHGSCSVCLLIPKGAAERPEGNVVKVDLRGHIAGIHNGSNVAYKTANVTSVEIVSMSSNLDQPLLVSENGGANNTFQTAAVVGVPTGHQGSKVNNGIFVVPPRAALASGYQRPLALAIDKPSEECMQRYRDIDFAKVERGFTRLPTDPRNPDAAVAWTYVSQYTDGEDPFLSLVYLNADRLTTPLSGTFVGSASDPESIVGVQFSDADKNKMMNEMTKRISAPLGRTVIQLAESAGPTGPCMSFTVTPMSRDSAEAIAKNQARNQLPKEAEVFVGLQVDYTLYT